MAMPVGAPNRLRDEGVQAFAVALRGDGASGAIEAGVDCTSSITSELTGRGGGSMAGDGGIRT